MECVYSALFFLNTNQHLPRENIAADGMGNLPNYFITKLN